MALHPAVLVHVLHVPWSHTGVVPPHFGEHGEASEPASPPLDPSWGVAPLSEPPPPLSKPMPAPESEGAPASDALSVTPSAVLHATTRSAPSPKTMTDRV